ncbi:30S ribosomal protein S12 methylthiotransferase RimO [Bacteroidales bacterium OttesenSCG-928-B11]|nr:30S ribosomal protein S12 methylthiotransferase RimO [Bacteroidales bacterium OttesenSCG-928-E04]MDL2308997.1 30S ribosomal protein S12 methylthiotransferase RimO [Bacteroidales bacterium OttesenSCG-928-C03]MDL2312208.1 30S ribosomal protein S12 methylthiotransferase RimO [Bacteroidales bacterium OttesenSCG-928-B11]MDL2326859.1 30S ribosomal protein S12 methylthiotransferase RimO [Bacteroidales bacterium OttesenSCG-928-A14]
MTINIITLGCSKNSVDSEVIAAHYVKRGHEVVFESDSPSDIVLLNTCSFILDAKEESIEEIIIQIERKRKGDVGKVFVMGCLAQRYKDDLRKSLPEVDGIFSFTELPDMLSDSRFDLLTYPHRKLTQNAHFAYLKLSEGCDRQCAFCAIPGIRGKQFSKPIERLVGEANYLVEQGVKEVMLIAQDSTAYGTDIYNRRELEKLMRELAGVKGLEWIRLHYAYPNDFPLPVLDVMREYDNICKYIDIPIQHVSENVLRAMNRPSSPDRMRRLIETIRKKVPGISIRTTILTGFPTETQQDHEELLGFLEEIRFDKLGAFTYSQEEGTPAYSLGDPISEDEKADRLEEIMDLQENISLEINEKRIGETMKVIVDDVIVDERINSRLYAGRTQFDSPEVDGMVLVYAPYELEIGEFYDVKIKDAEEYDLIGEI